MTKENKRKKMNVMKKESPLHFYLIKKACFSQFDLGINLEINKNNNKYEILRDKKVIWEGSIDQCLSFIEGMLRWNNILMQENNLLNFKIIKIKERTV